MDGESIDCMNYPHLQMNRHTRQQQGSPARDTFKYLHKTLLPRSFFACDVDLLLVEKNPFMITAAIDFKLPNDRITFTEVIAYNEFIKRGLPVYVVTAAGEITAEQRFGVSRYLGGDPIPTVPTTKLKPVCRGVSWDGLALWERALRRQRKP